VKDKSFVISNIAKAFYTTLGTTPVKFCSRTTNWVCCCYTINLYSESKCETKVPNPWKLSDNRMARCWNKLIYNLCTVVVILIKTTTYRERTHFNLVGRFWTKENLCSFRESNPPLLGDAAFNVITTLSYPDSKPGTPVSQRTEPLSPAPYVPSILLNAFTRISLQASEQERRQIFWPNNKDNIITVEAGYASNVSPTMLTDYKFFLANYRLFDSKITVRFEGKNEGRVSNITDNTAIFLFVHLSTYILETPRFVTFVGGTF
jgi:hypothetical protein